MEPAQPNVEVVSTLPVLAPRSADSYKHNFGRILVVAGCRGMSGAAVLCASAALRGGAGLVRLAVPGELLPLVAVANPCYMTAPLEQDDYGRLDERATGDVLDLAAANDVVAFGPGLGRSSAITALGLALVEQSKAALVIDADGLTSLKGMTRHLAGRPYPLILTPHAGEFARLLGSDVDTVQAQRQELAVRFAAEYRLILVLKGHHTIVTDGRRVAINNTGNPGMATGGTGDVLTGLVAALLGQGLEPFAAAQLAVHVHGLAGDLARDQMGEVSMIASDLLDYIPAAFRSLRG
jgi:NAD(P)H-hydrate epimerase